MNVSGNPCNRAHSRTDQKRGLGVTEVSVILLSEGSEFVVVEDEIEGSESKESLEASSKNCEYKR